MDKVEVDSNPDIGILSFNHSLDATGDAVFNAELTAHVDVEVMKVFAIRNINLLCTLTKLSYFQCVLKFKKPENDDDKTYTKELLSHDIDVCDLKEGVFSNFLMKAFMTNFEKSANFKIKCPFKKVCKFVISNLIP